RMNGAAAASGCDESGEIRIVFRRVRFEPRLVTLEHRGDTILEQLLDAREMTRELGERPFVGDRSAIECAVVEAGRDPADILGVLSETRNQLTAQVMLIGCHCSE